MDEETLWLQLVDDAQCDEACVALLRLRGHAAIADGLDRLLPSAERDRLVLVAMDALADARVMPRLRFLVLEYAARGELGLVAVAMRIVVRVGGNAALSVMRDLVSHERSIIRADATRALWRMEVKPS